MNVNVVFIFKMKVEGKKISKNKNKKNIAFQRSNIQKPKSVNGSSQVNSILKYSSQPAHLDP